MNLRFHDLKSDTVEPCSPKNCRWSTSGETINRTTPTSNENWYLHKLTPCSMLSLSWQELPATAVPASCGCLHPERPLAGCWPEGTEAILTCQTLEAKMVSEDFPSSHLNDQSSSAAASISVQNCALISLALANLGDWSMAGIGGSWWTKLLTFKPGQGFGYVQGDLDRKDTSYLLQTRLRVSDTSRLSTIFQFSCFLSFLTIRISFRWNHGNLKKLMWLSLSLKSTQWNIQILSPASGLLGFWLLRVRCEHK
jgi:hypothetical protein